MLNECQHRSNTGAHWLAEEQILARYEVNTQCISCEPVNVRHLNSTKVKIHFGKPFEYGHHCITLHTVK